MNIKGQSKVIAGCYCRLSDDDEQDGMSVSIETQIKILGDYCRDNGMYVHKFYTDDGYTGTNFNRPDFKRMMADAENGAINTIIVKDLSRFGRNYVQIGLYMSEILPNLGVRFIAIGDDVDSNKGNLDYDLMIPIKNIFNEYYPADCSRKTRQAFVAKASNGEYIGAQAPYGYRKSKEDKHVLEINEETGPVVVFMFEMAAYQGYGYNKIARVLKERKILTPSAYQAKQAGREYNKDPYDWNLITVYKMLENEVYLGHLVSGKRRKASFKSKRVIKQSEDQWIIVRNTHQALITEQLWNDAHMRLGSRKVETSSGFDNIFAGLLKCDKCGYSLGLSNARNRAPYYMCNTYKKKGVEKCSSHYVTYEELYNAVLADIRSVLYYVRTKEDAFYERVLKKLDDRKVSHMSEYEREASMLQAKIAELERKFDRLYDDRFEGLLSDRKFRELSVKCETEQDIALERLNYLKEKMAEESDKTDGAEQFLELAKKYSDVRELDREILNRLVESIVVGDRVKENDETVQQITINYRFIGAV